MSFRALLCSLALLSVLMGDTAFNPSQKAHAQFIGDRPFSGKRNIELNIHMGTFYGYGWDDNGYNRPYYYGNYTLATGIQMLFPVLHNGFIKSINNAFYLGFFTDLVFHPDYYGGFGNSFFMSLAFGPVAQWRFQLFEIFSVYANLGFGLWPWFTGDRYYGTLFRGFPLFELGGNVHFSKNVALTFSAGYPSSKIGVSIGF